MKSSYCGLLWVLLTVISASCQPHRPPAPPIAPKSPVGIDISTKHVIESTAGGFKIAFPENPQRKLDKDIDGKPTENYHMQRSDSGLVVGFSYPQIPVPDDLINEAVIAGGLDGAASAFVKKTNGEFISKKDIRLGQYQGLEFDSKINGANPTDTAAAKGRVFWVDKRLIRVLAIGQPAWLQSKEVEAFFESFELNPPAKK